jgi:hypothetical protein
MSKITCPICGSFDVELHNIKEGSKFGYQMAGCGKCCAAWYPSKFRAPAQQWTAERLAREFHELYEATAADFGYVTRPETREFIADSPNGRLMIDVCHNILRRLEPLPSPPDSGENNDG